MDLAALKDPDSAHPIAPEWRPTLRDLVKAFAAGDFRRVRPDIAKQIAAYVLDYGETLAELPDETWNSSLSQWMGTHWEVIVDLWTVESGRSDLILSVQVFEEGCGFRFDVDSVHVP